MKQHGLLSMSRGTSRRFAVTLASATSLFIASLSGLNAGTISQVPLYISLGGTDPNILFMLDDSGSMMFEVIPDELTHWNETNGSVVYVYPRAGGVYGSSDYNNNVATVASTKAYTAVMRSAAVNKMYYDPAVTYTPWKKYDGSSYANASTTCALHNPERSGTGSDYCRDLTAYIGDPSGTQWRTCNSTSCTSSTGEIEDSKFPAATYYHYNSGDIWNLASYTKTSIVPSTTSYSGHGRSNRTDCATPGTCTYAEEIQNFANWYTYYRSRVLAARAGIGKAFVGLNENVRVGFGAINLGSQSIDGVSSNAIKRGLRSFTTTNRQNFYSDLYTHPIPAQGTPLRLALDAAGNYFSRTDDKGPWADTPGTSSTCSSSCRQSYTILMTDGYWSGGTDYDADTSQARSDNDSTDGPTNTGPNSLSYTFSAASPFKDDRPNTLADVAMHYWKNDLNTSLANRVPVSTLDPAFWQHMVTFGVGLGVSGSVSSTSAFDAITSHATITWPDPNASNTNCADTECSARVDDLLHASVNSRGGFFSAQNPGAFASGLAGTLGEIVARMASTAAALATNSTSIGSDTLLYQAKFDSSDWSGQLLAYKINTDGTVASTATWDTSTAGKIPTFDDRKIYSRIGSDNIELKWSSLTAAQQTTLTGIGLSEKVVNWLRGDRSNETTAGGLRKRTYLLGDIVNSNPAYVSSLNFGYELLPSGTAGRDTYAAFKDTNNSRTKMVYIGANDGMLHAFKADNGEEKFAFVPPAVLSNLGSLSTPGYTHKYFVDGSPQAGDAYIGGAWKTVLVTSTGAGGKSMFALDVTNPDSFSQTKVLWSFTDTDLGYPIGQLVQPVIGRMQNGDWAVVFGNGYQSTNNRAFLYVVKLSDGSLISKIDTGAGSSTSPNGLAGPVLLADEFRTIKYAYAGDLLGNLWKFDLSSASCATSSTCAWDVAFKSGTTSKPLFQARHVSGTTETVQPVTAPPEIADHPNGGFMIYFGTGKFFETGDNSTTSAQSLYGIWDKNDGSSSYITATNRSTLQGQTIIAQSKFGTADNWRVVSDNAISWTGTGAKRGWYLDLIPPDGVKKGERVVSVPLIRHGRAIFTTLVPSTDVCDAGGTSWIMEMDMISGARLGYSVFDVNGDGTFTDADYVTLADGTRAPTSGYQPDVGIINTPSVISSGAVEYKYAGGSTAKIARIPEKGAPGVGRQSWRQLR